MKEGRGGPGGRRAPSLYTRARGSSGRRFSLFPSRAVPERTPRPSAGTPAWFVAMALLFVAMWAFGAFAVRAVWWLTGVLACAG